MIKKCLFYSLCITTTLLSGAFLGKSSPANLAQTFTLTPQIQLIITQGDITQAPVQAIINAANEELQGGGGVCGAIFNAAGWDQLQNACNAIVNPNTEDQNNGILCSTGQACITPSFNLKSTGIQWIIHAVGPIYDGTTGQDSELASAYTNSLIIAGQKKLTSIAFPFISSGIYGFPKQSAATLALTGVKNYCKQNPKTSVTKIYFVLHSQEDFALFCKSAKSM